MEGSGPKNFDPVANINHLSHVFGGIQGDSKFKILAGIGEDDCGVFSFNGTQFVVSTDFINASPIMLQYGGTYYDLGRYLVNVNLSDCLSSGALPLTFLSNLMFQKESPESHFIDLVEGMHFELNRRNIPLLGGDTKLGKSNSFSGTIIGYSDKKLFLQSHARIGDIIWCSGQIGGVATSLLGLFDSESSDALPKEIKVQLIGNLTSPELEYDKGLQLIELAVVNAGTDLSDGLLSDLGCICKNSGCGAEVDLDKIPVNELTRNIAHQSGWQPWMLPLVLGGDLQYIVTSPLKNAAVLESLGFFKIGQIIQSGNIRCSIGKVSFTLPFIGHNDAHEGGFYNELICNLEMIKTRYNEALN